MIHLFLHTRQEPDDYKTSGLPESLWKNICSSRVRLQFLWHTKTRVSSFMICNSAAISALYIWIYFQCSRCISTVIMFLFLVMYWILHHILPFKMYGIVERRFQLSPNAVSCNLSGMEAKFVGQPCNSDRLFLGPCYILPPNLMEKRAGSFSRCIENIPSLVEVIRMWCKIITLYVVGNWKLEYYQFPCAE